MLSLTFAMINQNKYTKEELNQYTNEELINLIRDGNQQIHWELLWLKTQNTIYKVYHEDVHAYYKDTCEDDIINVLSVGWIQAVKTYDDKKATDLFYKYAIYIIRQHYRKYVRRIKPTHIGKSIRFEFLSDVKIANSGKHDSSDTEFVIDNILEDKDSDFEFNSIELNDYLSKGMEKLKKIYPESYECIIENIYNEKSIRTIAKERGKTPQRICDIIKRGYNFLRLKMNEKELY